MPLITGRVGTSSQEDGSVPTHRAPPGLGGPSRFSMTRMPLPSAAWARPPDQLTKAISTSCQRTRRSTRPSGRRVQLAIHRPSGPVPTVFRLIRATLGSPTELLIRRGRRKSRICTVPDRTWETGANTGSGPLAYLLSTIASCTAGRAASVSWSCQRATHCRCPRSCGPSQGNPYNRMFLSPKLHPGHLE